MNWFKGEIAEAIVSSKAKKAIFVVYIEGKDEKSSQITELINKDEVAQILSSDKFVAIKIEGESVPYQQFSQIYKQVPVPSIYFIGDKGVPLEIVTEVKDGKTFTDKLNSILQKAGMSTVAAQSENFINNEQSQAIPIPPNVVCENGVCTIKKNDKADEPSTSQTNMPEKTTGEDKKELSVEEKVERAKQLVEKKREDKKREEEEEERQKEIERRKMGQNVQQLKRWQDDQELKHALEEREKEKRESQAARERVLAQIAQDKAERAAKFSSASQQPQVAPQAAPRPSASTSNTARLQFRMPDGRTATNDFSSSATLESVHAHIRTNLNLPFANYTLSTTFPRREFTENDKSQSLADLGLVPTAVILILPVNRGVVVTSSGGGFTGFLWSLLTPIFTLLGYLKTFVFGSGQAPNPPSSNTDGVKRAADTPSDSRTQAKIRRGGETTVVRRQGNIHRLSNKNDSDDENNTWNGNSTQQM